ncbi:MAG: hypothetical protein V7641_4348 [Blastocatellia bacterium]
MTKRNSKDKSFRRTRREFAKRLAVAAATPLVARAGIAHEAQPAAVQQTPPPANPFAPQAEALTEVVRRRYPQYLNDEQLEAVKRSIERALRGGDTLNKFALTNGDEPAFAFSADLPEAFAEAPKQQAGEREEEGRASKKKRQPRRN